MRSLRSLLAVLTIVVVAGCTSAKPGWTYAPVPSATPVASGEPSASTEPSGSAAPSGAPSASTAPTASAGGSVVAIAAQAVAFDKAELSVPAGQPFQILFTNNDAAILHNVAILEGSPTGAEVYKGELFPGVAERTYDVPALTAGAYAFICSVHPNMVGTLTAG